MSELSIPSEPSARVTIGYAQLGLVLEDINVRAADTKIAKIIIRPIVDWRTLSRVRHCWRAPDRPAASVARTRVAAFCGNDR